ncbi:MAG: ATP-dependent Zn protease [Pirellulaceae bacterium]|jgi:ATP-dependent Zn protease
MPELTAYHEAGHAVIAMLLGGRVASVTIDPENDDGPERYGDTKVEWLRDRFSDKEFHENLVQVALAGPVAEMIYRGEPLHPGFVAEWSGDWRTAWEMAAALHSDEQKRLQYLELTTTHLHRLLKKEPYWSALAAVSDNLLAHERLDNEELEDIVRAWL